MKKVSKTISVLALLVFLNVGPTIAQTGQTTDSQTTTRSSTDDNGNRDDHGKWGLLGLAGLLGLLGLKRKDDDRHRSTTVNR